MIKLKKLLEETDNIFLDRHGSLPSRPPEAKFSTSDAYNDHMGFDASLTGNENIPIEQQKTVKDLLKKGFRITGTSKMPDNSNQYEILMTKKTKFGGSEYRDVLPDGKIT